MRMRIILAVALMIPATATAGETSPEADVRAVIAAWYAELAKEEDGRPWMVTAPGFIDASPHYDYVNDGSAALGPRIFTSLAARALQFAYDIDVLRLDADFAKVVVWERGYFYASAAEVTYEMAAMTIFVLERRDDAGWLILAHGSSSSGIPPNKITDPMPDMKDLFCEGHVTDAVCVDPDAPSP